MQKNLYFVLDIGGTYIKYALMDRKCKFVKKGKRPTPRDSFQNFLAAIYKIFEKYSDRISGIALSCAGVIDSTTGYMENGGSLEYIKQVNLKEILEKRCHVPVSVENDARCAGLAEVWKGSLSGCKIAAAMILGTAVGGVVLIDGKVLLGMHLMAGEFSYLLTNADDAENPEKTFAKRGGVPWLLRDAAEKLDIAYEGFSGEKLFGMAAVGNETALICARNYARQIAVQIMNLQFMLDPERIAIGGGVSTEKILITLIKEEIKKLTEVYPHPVPLPEITTCRFYNDSNLIGALYSYLEKYEE